MAADDEATTAVGRISDSASAEYAARDIQLALDDVPHGYKRTEAGIVPNDWGVSSVGEEFHIQLGKMLDSRKNTGAAKLYVGNRAVQWGRIDINKAGIVLMNRFDLHRYRLKEGDLLVCEGGEIGRSAIWHVSTPECYYQKALHRLRHKNGYNSFLMMALFELWSSSGALDDYVTQTSIAHLPKEKLETVPVPVPSRFEQHAIATALSDVDGLLDALDKLIAKKRTIKQAAMQQLLTGRTRLPGFSGAWKTKRLGDITDIDSENLGTTTRASYTFNYISLEAVEAGKLLDCSVERFSSAPSRARRIIREGDVLISTVRPNLQSHLLFDGRFSDAICSTGFAVVRCDSSTLASGYVYAHMFGRHVNEQIDRIIAGSNYPAISSSDVKNLSLSIPSFEEQTAIATVLSDMDAEIDTLEQRRAKTRELKTGMMQQLLTGRVRLVEPEAAA